MHRHILVTGATGALGPHLAAELLAAKAADRIAILVRPTAPGDAPMRERFERWLKIVATLVEQAGAPAGELYRLHPVAGDICNEGLGLNGTGEGLRREVDVVVHAAADTNFAADGPKQWDVNVEGTRRTLEFAADCSRLQKFVHVSSTYVAGSRTGAIPETVAADKPDFVTHYQLTKWEAERLVLASGLPAQLARISLIMGSHATGFIHRTGALHSMIRWFGRGLVPVLPAVPHSTADLIPTELAAQCLTRAVTAGEASPSSMPIWHIAAGQQAPAMGELVDFVFEQFAQQPAWRRRGIPKAKLISQDEFNQFVQTMDSTGHPALAQALRSINLFLPDLLYPKIYQTSRAEEMWGGSLPLPDWRQTLGRVIGFCCMRGSDSGSGQRRAALSKV